MNPSIFVLDYLLTHLDVTFTFRALRFELGFHNSPLTIFYMTTLITFELFCLHIAVQNGDTRRLWLLW